MRKTVLFVSAGLWIAACGWDPSKPFEREAPPVKEAIGALDAGDASAASELLEQYLSTGACADGKIGAPGTLKKLSNGSFDLGLALFRIGEAYGRRFGEEEMDAGSPELHAQRMAQIDCAIRIVEAIANDESQPIDLRARARYLEGNLHFLGGEYEQAVAAYDKALTLAPGMEGDAGDAVGRDAAFNRAIALRRIEDKKNDAGNDGGQPDGGGDAGSNDGGGDASNDGGDGGGGGGNDAGQDSGGGGDDGGKDSGPDAGDDGGQQSQNEPDAMPPSPTQTQDDRVLDKLEATPTFQQEVAKKQAQQRHGRVRGMVDK